MDTKLVIRALDDAGQLIGWAEVLGVARGDGKLWVEAPTPIFAEKLGRVTQISTHWCDLNVEIRVPVDPVEMRTGDFFTIPDHWEAITLGPAAGGLPPVTVRNPITVGVPVGSFSPATGSMLVLA